MPLLNRLRSKLATNMSTTNIEFENNTSEPDQAIRFMAQAGEYTMYKIGKFNFYSKNKKKIFYTF